MTRAKPSSRRRRPTRADDSNADLDVLDRDDPFRKKKEALRAFVVEHGAPKAVWSEAETEEFRRLSRGDFVAVGFAFSAPGGTTATSENPHGPYGEASP